jgi:chloramphenicol 3-O phosphotransferase
VILLNGTPSSGKTTIARALWDDLEPPHWYRSLDDFRQGYQTRHWRADQGPLFDQVFRGFIRSVREMALVGHDVITESVMLPGTIDAYLDALDGIAVYLVGVRCPLDVAQRRERERTDRGSGPLDLAIPDFDLVHAGRPYDVEFDTSMTSIPEAVLLIREALATGRPPSAFEVLRSRRLGGSA